MLTFPLNGTFSNRNNAKSQIHNDAMGEIAYMTARGIYRGHISDKGNFSYEPIPQHEIPRAVLRNSPKKGSVVRESRPVPSAPNSVIVNATGSNQPYYCLYRGRRMPPFTYSGKLQLIVGPMYSGKTSEMERYARREKIAGREVLIIKPSVDTRFQTNDEVVSHDNLRIPAKSCNHLNDLMEDILKSDVICIDEGQFIPDILEVADLLCNIGKIVIIAMLHATFQRTPFPKGNPMRLLSMADNIQFLTSVCVMCGMEASNSYMVTYKSPTENNKDNHRKNAPTFQRESQVSNSACDRGDGTDAAESTKTKGTGTIERKKSDESCIIIEGDGEKQARYEPRCRRCFME